MMSKTKFKPRIGWWFSQGDVLPHGDGRKIIIGERLAVKGKLVICRNALHGSFDPLDALQYAPGSILHKCLYSGARIEEKEKLGSRYRTVLARHDATGILRQFAREQALSVIHLWDAPQIVREYLETGDETKRDAARAAAAWDAARAAASAAAWEAARAAARASGWDDAWDAAWEAARAAAWGAAWDAARAAAAWDAAREAAWGAAWAAARATGWDDALGAAWDAARGAARAAAWGAAWDAARERFNELVNQLFEGE